MRYRKRIGKTKETVNVVVHGLRPPRPQKRPGDRRGKNPDFIKNQFKAGKGENLDPRIERGLTLISKLREAGAIEYKKPMPKFADAYSLTMMDPLPKALCKKLKVPVGTTLMDLTVNRIAEMAARGSLPHVQEIREVTQGKVPNQNLNLSVELQAYAENEEFRKFIADRYAEFLATRPQRSLTTGDSEL
jgi:hypothetical protein